MRVKRIIVSLSSYSVHATFFLTGQDLSRNEGAARKLRLAGNEIDNHSWSHRQLIFRSPQNIAEEIESTDKEIRTVGQAAPIYFRLMHVLTASRKASRSALPRILSWLKADGYRMGTVSELLAAAAH